MALVQIGTVVEVGLTGITYSGFVVTAVSGPQRQADQAEIKDADAGETQTVIFTNPRKEVSLTGVVKNAADNHAELIALEAMKPGDVITLSTAALTGSADTRGASEDYYISDSPTFDRKPDGVTCSFTATLNAGLGDLTPA